MKWLSPVVFLGIVLGHFLYATQVPETRSNTQWAAYEFQVPHESRLARYVEPGEIWLGLSYGLAGAFAAWCFGLILTKRREALATSAGGFTLGGILWAGVCFVTGCCGSPMLPIYMGLFGPKFLNVTKPLTFGITLLSITIGYVWMLKRAPERIRGNVNTGLHENAGANASQV